MINQNYFFLAQWKSNYVLLLLAFISITACKVDQEAINYGHDQCHYCHMTIVDKIHGAEIVNDKGKVFKYDAVECMINDLQDFESGEAQLQLVNHYERATELITAAEAYYLISEQLPSPMGAFLTAFPNHESALKAKGELGGQLYDWPQLKDHLKPSNAKP